MNEKRLEEERDETATVTEQIDRKHLEDLERLKNFRLMDDDFFTKCFDGNKECVELVLRIIMDKPDLMVLDARTQVFIANLLERSVRLDVLATDEKNQKYNIEIQRADKGAGNKRARFNSSMLDANLLKKGGDFPDLPETYVIFITENDVMGKGLPIYSIERCIMETGELFGDGEHIKYVNGKYRGQSQLGRLMHDFSCTNASDMYYKTLAERVRFYKEDKEGVEIMCKAMEDMRNETYREATRDNMVKVAARMLEENKYTIEEIVKISGLTADEISQLKK